MAETQGNTPKMTRARIESNAFRVTLTYTDRWDGEITRVFVAPLEHGYVREIGRNSDYRQVCERLRSTGRTLMASNHTLVSVIRREWRRRQRAERKERDS